MKRLYSGTTHEKSVINKTHFYRKWYDGYKKVLFEKDRFNKNRNVLYIKK